MNLWIAFFRGINVGGHHIVPMKDLRALLEQCGCHSVRTYIQSGNVVFLHRNPEKDPVVENIQKAVELHFGFCPQVLLLTVDELTAAHEANPFPAAEENPKSLHLYFLAETADYDRLEKLDAVKGNTEQYRLVGQVFYLYAPEGIGRSKLAANVEKLVGVPATARNWRTVAKVLQLAIS